LTEDLLDRLEAAVRAHYAQTNAPLLLSQFGQRNKELITALKAEFSTLAAAVRAAGDDRIQIVDERRGRESMAPADIATEVARQVKEQSASQQLSSSSFDGLPKPVQIAFCLRTQAGQHVAIRVSPPFKYDVVSSLDLLRSSFRPLPDRYRRPGLLLRSASLQDRETLWHTFLAWPKMSTSILRSSRRAHKPMRSHACSRLRTQTFLAD
jgi:hypothetical protein